ncbi:MAG: hypothetical protein EZS28_003453 [Streblomastix strix]|uniref:Uncharacterized protein n=1 Tax=Streblomastix strix TaxID=222440 RepID=A0A5J4X172_9EUKA|nr:MAG: hypothetical protein EZS28_003453 [Streblomastix strix]
MDSIARLIQLSRRVVIMGTTDEDKILGHDILAELESPAATSSITPVNDLCNRALVQVLTEQNERDLIRDNQDDDKLKTVSQASLTETTRSQSVLRAMVKDQAQNDNISTDGLTGTAQIVREAIRNRRDFFWDVSQDVRAQISKDTEIFLEVKPPERSEEPQIPKTTEEVEDALKAVQEKNNINIAMLLGVNASMIEGLFDPDSLEVALALAAEAKGTFSAARRGKLYGFHQNSSAPEILIDPSFDAAKRVKESFPLISFHDAKKTDKPTAKSGFFRQKGLEKSEIEWTILRTSYET